MDIREEFLKFFESKGHGRVQSSPLVPDDASLLFTNAGMVPFKTIFTGEVPRPNPPRATSCQTCLRAGGKHNDLENVGHTARHHTFFEMLGNFSFGDYFKEDAIAYAWEFVTEVIKLPVEKLYVTVHDSDDEAFGIWEKYIAKERIYRMGDKDNFWQMGDTGPCGPCSEIFYDQGEEHFNGPEDYMGGDGDRFLEIWNLVFMQYEQFKDGTRKPLPKPSIDTGMGLERVIAVKEGVLSNFDSSAFMPIIKKVEALIGKSYAYETGASYRVIADHVRTCSFLIAQGINFDKEGRGYVMRRILRRAIRHGYLLGFSEPFMYKVVDSVIELMGSHYEYLIEKRDIICENIRLEEERFFKTIASGIALFNEELKNTKETFSGEVAFKLYDTYGFPLDLTQDMAREKNINVDEKTFDALMNEQRSRAKAAWKGSGDSKVEGDFKALLENFGENSFVGYNTLSSTAKVLALLDENFQQVDASSKGWVLLDKTPFYAESGGQTGDKGCINENVEVIDTKKFFGLNLSSFEGTLEVGSEVSCHVNTERAEIARHHSATHILHAVLRESLGEHVEQKGSLVEQDRLRFDFSHPKALTQEELKTIESTVNARIGAAISNDTQEMSIEAAKEKGAMALFGEKYGDSVRVVAFGDASIELCGGCHVNNTAEIGTFAILKESGVSAGVRRIEAVCSQSAVTLFTEQRTTLEEAKAVLKNQDILVGIEKLKEQIKQLKQEVVDAQNASKKEIKAEEINGVNIVVDVLEGGDIKERVDELKNQYESLAVMLFQVKGPKVLIAAGSKNASVKAGAWIKEIAPVLGGGGGGRDDFAQAGGKDASKIDEAKEKALLYLQNNL